MSTAEGSLEERGGWSGYRWGPYTGEWLYTEQRLLKHLVAGCETVATSDLCHFDKMRNQPKMKNTGDQKKSSLTFY